MAEAQFSGYDTRAVTDGLSSGLSLMERSQQMRLRQQQATQSAAAEEDRKKRETIMMPVMLAKAKADVLELAVHVGGLKQTEEARAQALTTLPTARSDFDGLMQLADPDAREQAGLEWIGKYGQLANVAAFKDEFTTKKDVIAGIHQEAMTLRHLGQTIEGQKEVANIRAAAAVETAGVRVEAGDKVARYRKQLQEATSAGDEEGVALYSSLLQKAAASPINTAYGSDQMRQKLEEAKANGDPDEISFWEKRIKALNSRGVKQSQAEMIKGVLDALPGGSGTPAAKPAAAPGVTEVPSKIQF